MQIGLKTFGLRVDTLNKMPNQTEISRSLRCNSIVRVMDRLADRKLARRIELQESADLASDLAVQNFLKSL